MNAIALNEVKFSYGKSAANIINIESWELKQGQQVFVQGASGSGKSTLLNLLTGVIRPQSGTINVLETAITELSSRKMDKFRARNIGVVFQQFNLIPYLTVSQNILLASYFAQSKQTEHRVLELLNALNLPESVANQLASELSVGQQQRVAIARALINSPELLIVDEPTSALDADARDAFMTLLTSICEKNKTSLVFVSHDKALAQFFELHVDLADLNSATA